MKTLKRLTHRHQSLFATTASAGIALLGANAVASTDYGPAIWNSAYSGHWYTSGNGHNFHVIHDMEGYYLSTISYFQQSGTSASVHYCVNGKKDATSDAPAGEITQMVREANYAWHVRCWNTYSTGTEHEGFQSNPAWYTEAMYQASAGITKHLATKFTFGKDRNHIVGHNAESVSGWPTWAANNLGIDPYCNSHSDPGPYWDWSHYMALVKGTVKHAVCDFDGDGKTDFTVYRPSTFKWYVYNGTSLVYGTTDDIPEPGDYDGDGQTDYAVFRPSDGTWHVYGQTIDQYGAAGDIPCPADYDGDGQTDYAVWRPSNGTWYINGQSSLVYGLSTDILVPGNYYGGNKAERVVWRPSDGTWHSPGHANVAYGANGDIPVPGDYSGDGIMDRAVYRPSNNIWYREGMANVQYGAAGDIPAPGDYNGDGKTDIAVFRPSDGTFHVYNQTIVQWGTNGDAPLSLPSHIRRMFFPN
jgi:hypothetical protein